MLRKWARLCLSKCKALGPAVVGALRFAAQVNMAEATAGVDTRVGSTCRAVEVLDKCCGAVTGASWATVAAGTAAARAEGGIGAPTEEVGTGGMVATGCTVGTEAGVTAATPPP